jgi:hypothetical protein
LQLVKPRYIWTQYLTELEILSYYPIFDHFLDFHYVHSNIRVNPGRLGFRLRLSIFLKKKPKKKNLTNEIKSNTLRVVPSTQCSIHLDRVIKTNL